MNELYGPGPDGNSADVWTQWGESPIEAGHGVSDD